MLHILIIFIGNLDGDSLSIVSELAQSRLSPKAAPLLDYCNESLRCALINLTFSAEQILAGKKSRLHGSLSNKRERTSESKASRVITVVGRLLPT